MSSLDYIDLCRLCLVKDRVSVPIFEGEGDARQIYFKIAACLPVKVTREDKLPKKICNDCVYKLELFYQFWTSTAAAEKQLQQWLGIEVNMEDKQGYVSTVLNPSGMKPEQSNENRLDGTVLQQVSEHQNNMNIAMMDNMSMGMPMMMASNTPQQITSVPMDNSGSSVQNVQPVAGPSTQTTHDQITQNQTDAPTQQEDEEESSEEDDNSDDECEGDEGLPIKEEGEEDPNNSRTIEPTTFVNVSLACDEAGPSGLQQQKIADIPEMVMPPAADVDPKTGQRRGKSRIVHQCVMCGACFRHTRKLVEHLKNLHNIDRAFRCNECSKTFRSPMNIARHKLIHTGMKMFTCDLCEYSTNQKSNLECHYRRHAKDYSFKCETCGKGFFHKIEYLEHQSAHTSKNLYRCEHCHKCYLYKKNLSVHLMAYHADQQASSAKNAKTKHVCKFCPERFVYKRLLKRHMKNQHGFADETPMKHLCDLCGAVLSSKRRLMAHKRSHTNEKIFKCDVCNKAFVSKENLNIHKRTHTGERPHVCLQCGRSFTQRTSLVLHLRYHSGQRPYECLDCGKGFVSNTLLKRHHKVHEKTMLPKT